MTWGVLCRVHIEEEKKYLHIQTQVTPNFLLLYTYIYVRMHDKHFAIFSDSEKGNNGWWCWME
jgi:hypothetical protein